MFDWIIGAWIQKQWMLVAGGRLLGPQRIVARGERKRIVFLPAIALRARMALENGIDSKLSEMSNGGMSKFSAEMVAAAANAEDAKLSAQIIAAANPISNAAKPNPYPV